LASKANEKNISKMIERRYMGCIIAFKEF